MARTCDGGLVDCSVATCHGAIHGHGLARPHAHHGPHLTMHDGQECKGPMTIGMKGRMTTAPNPQQRHQVKNNSRMQL